MIEAVSAETASSFDRLMLILVGKEKSGKSRTAATSRKPTLFHDFDKRRQALAGIPGVYSLTYMDEQWPKQPTGFSDHLTVLTMLEAGQTLKQIGMNYGQKDWPDVRPRTQVYDSIASMAKCANGYCLYTNKSLRRSIKVGGQEIYFNDGWDAVNAEMESLNQSIMRLFAMKDQDIILIFHEENEQTDDSTPEKTKLTGKIDLYPRRYKVFNKFFNEVWRVSREQGGMIPTIQMSPDFRFTASSNLDFSKIPPGQIVPDIAKLIKMATGKD
jgi:hypothetical protein